MADEAKKGVSFNTHVDACVGIVVDPFHQRYGQSADVLMHDWKESGAVYIRFPDGIHDSLQDGMMSDDPELPQVKIMLRSDTVKVEALQQELSGIRERLIGLVAVGNKRRSTPKDRMVAKEAFWELIRTTATED